MCGRYTLTAPVPIVADHFLLNTVPALEPRYNIAPTQSVLAVRQTVQGEREGVLLRWGLVPSWAHDLSMGNRLLNARAETVAEKPAFRTALARRRCLIPADGFYEWQSVAGKKQPLHFRFRDGRLFAMAGLWERWHSPAGEIVETCTVLTTCANDLIRVAHDRMPVILDPAHYPDWLDPRCTDTAELLPFLRSWPADEMAVVPASPRVNNARNEGAACLGLA